MFLLIITNDSVSSLIITQVRALSEVCNFRAILLVIQVVLSYGFEVRDTRTALNCYSVVADLEERWRHSNSGQIVYSVFKEV